MTRTPEAIAHDDAIFRLIAAGVSLAIVVEGEKSTDYVTRHALESHAEAYRVYLDSLNGLSEAAITAAAEASIAAITEELRNEA